MEIKLRINRIIGQLKGIEKMVANKRDCAAVLQQVSAIKKAIDGLSKEIVVSGISSYVAPGELKKVEEMLERAINL